MKKIFVFLLTIVLLSGCAANKIVIPEMAPAADRKMRAESITLPDKDGKPMLFFIIGYDDQNNPKAFIVLDKDKKTVLNVVAPE